MLGTEKPADLMTKHLDQKSLDKMLHKLSVVVSEGRASSAPRLNAESDKKAQESSDSWTEVVDSLEPGARWADYDEDDGNGDVNNLEESNVEQDSAHSSGLHKSDKYQEPREGQLKFPHRKKEEIYEAAVRRVSRNPSVSPGEVFWMLPATEEARAPKKRKAAETGPRAGEEATADRGSGESTNLRDLAARDNEHELYSTANNLVHNNYLISPRNLHNSGRMSSIGDRRMRMKRHIVRALIVHLCTPVQKARGEVLISLLRMCHFTLIYMCLIVCMIICIHMQFCVDPFYRVQERCQRMHTLPFGSSDRDFNDKSQQEHVQAYTPIPRITVCAW